MERADVEKYLKFCLRWAIKECSLLCRLVFVFREKVDKGFIDACLYVKDRMEEVSSPDKEMVRISL